MTDDEKSARIRERVFFGVEKRALFENEHVQHSIPNIRLLCLVRR